MGHGRIHRTAGKSHDATLLRAHESWYAGDWATLKWSDVDWLNGKLSVQRGIVRQQLDDVKTGTSHKAITVTQTMIEVLKQWKQTTPFSAQEDWIFASPAQIGRLPWSADSVNDAYREAASAAGIAHVSTHSMRHTYR